MKTKGSEVVVYKVPAAVADVIDRRMAPVVRDLLWRSQCGRSGFFEQALRSAYLQGMLDAEQIYERLNHESEQRQGRGADVASNPKESGPA